MKKHTLNLTFVIMWMGAGRGRNSIITTTTYFIWQTLQLMIYSNALIEDEAVPFPQRVLLLNLLQVVKDASLKMIYLFKPLLFQKGCGLFAPIMR